MRAVVKIGTSSITNALGELDDDALTKLCEELVAARAAGHSVTLVCSGAIAAGMPALGITKRPTDIGTLQAIAAVGQPRLMERMSTLLGAHGVVAGQVLLTPYDFLHRTQYVHARETFSRLLDLGVVPVVNENDTVADDEIRFGDNDRIAALVANLIRADVLVMLTDTAGLFTADPRLDGGASLIEQIAAVDEALDAAVGGAGSARGSGGMATKLAAARIAAWSGVRAVIAAAGAPGVVADAIDGRAVGTEVAARPERLTSRKLWIAFAVGASGRVVVDDGARKALVSDGRSLLAAGVREVGGEFDAESAVEVVDTAGRVFAKGLVAMDANAVRAAAGRGRGELPAGTPTEVIHRDDLVVLE
jgi:glutamate 5-kinase